jgi:predicted acyl esterase
MRAVVLTLVAALVLSGCLAQGGPKTDIAEDDLPRFKAGITDVRERSALAFATNGSFSQVLVPGPFEILPALNINVPVAVPLGKGAPEQIVHMGVFLPKVPEGTKVPVIADVGPYYGDGDVHATRPANRLGRFLIENFVPHGYAVAQVSVLGTGDSVGCMDLMGRVEQAGIHAAVQWLGTQDWSNGNVGLIGRSYDGSTPFEAAMKANDPHLKTIVPISGLSTGVHDLMWRNGSAETRGPGLLWGLYLTYAYTGVPDPQLQAQQAGYNTICPDTWAGLPNALAAWATGDYVAPAANPYWTDRAFGEAVLKNYKGSVYFIHGMQDWNVDPHMAFPFYQQLEAAGLDVKGLFGQWGHHYPDRPNEHAHLRWDWAQDLLEWFDHYLRETGPKPDLHVEIQDNTGKWRVEQTYPPHDFAWQTYAMGKEFKRAGGDGQPITGPGQSVRLRTDPLTQDLRIAGLPQFHVTVTPTGPGGQLYAELRAVAGTQSQRVGHAIMDLRLHEGGKETVPVAPGVPIKAKMEFFPLDAVVPAGSVLELYITNTGRDYLPSPISTPVVLDLTDKSVLRLPVVQREAEVFFVPPGFEAK